ncbi:hypothetical protein [Geminicoccus flavidas]|uniref:hypothetical protein n=1 Tax=Geminicoccus flavidas TaxID=2506407 RepID=UPI001356D874|nr:hypothetical protein [Geminicoccus flavidas]
MLGTLIGIASFAIGVYIVGRKSPGRTILEPGISAAIAVLIGLLLSGTFTLGNLLTAGCCRSWPACWAAIWASGSRRGMLWPIGRPGPCPADQ